MNAPKAARLFGEHWSLKQAASLTETPSSSPPPTPQAILALLDEIDRLRDELSACTEHPGGCGYWREAAKRRTEERDQFKEENEALRESLQALIHISNATAWEEHSCGEIAKARKALEVTHHA
ncbi:hypothetical protein [Pseudomonas aeruginosa]|uniref:hypothetical protein n=1 Tax=Pseudomonas aeruginosa TaxID=287 RepID=UPI0011B0603D|nr:hypothetical protein [Pseudomonas aeruginosa]